MKATFITIGAPNNCPDQNGLGCVSYLFEMAKCQLSNADWCEFLNAVGYEKSLSLKLYHKDMESGILGGIDSKGHRSKVAGQTVDDRLHCLTSDLKPLTFAPKPGWEKKPVVYIRYEDVCRYCNWLMTGDTERGAYDMTQTPPKRLRGAKYFIPTDDEWYKAAYFDPNTQTYRQYPTGNDLPKLEQANFERGDAFSKGPPFYLSDVDEYESAATPFGCVQMGGNAWEVLEMVSRDGQGALRNHYRGGSFGYTETGLSKQNRDSAPYNGRCYVFGARIAHIPTGWHPTPKPLKFILHSSYLKVRKIPPFLIRNSKFLTLPMFLISNSKFVTLLRSLRIYARLVTPWLRAKRLASSYAHSDHAQGDRVLIIPCEPWSVNGSRGDEAMMLSTLQQARKRWPDILVDLLVDHHFTNESELETLGFNVTKEWATPILSWFRKSLPRYRAIYILGADVTDGVYGWWTSYTLLRFYDLFSRAGIETHYLGFSWSKTPNTWMRHCFPLLKKNLPLPVRDPISLERLQRFTRHRPIVQVADSAFMLSPRQSDRVTEILAWIDAQHQSGKLVIALNVHQMFNGTQAKGVDWESAVASTLNTIQRSPCSTRSPRLIYLLVPHDNRPKISDDEILSRLSSRLPSSRKIESVWHADEIKALVGACDGLIAGRMHISIAALGQGVPVFGLVYQGKFEGLWKLFGLGTSTCMPPETFITDPQSAQSKLETFIANLPHLRTTIASHLPEIKRLSAINYEPFHHS